MAEIHGTYDDRFQPVVDILSANIDSGEDVGASVAVIHEGEMVVDVWGGAASADGNRPWEADTITNVWSTTKTMMALCALMLADRGELDMYRPVADYWPEFAANGKEAIEVRHLMSHTAGLSGWETPLTIEEVCDWDKSTALLAEQAPWWEPGTASGYHALNQGHLVGEVVRRVTGDSLGAFFAKEVAGPLGAEFHIGLDPALSALVARVIPPSGSAMEMLDHVPAMDSPMMKTFANPVMDATASWTDWWRQAEVPAANGHGNARGVATAQAAISHGGEYNGVRLLSPETIDLIFDEQADGTDLVLMVPIRFGIGYGLTGATFPWLRADNRICHWGGWGGSLISNDLDENLTFAYMMNRMGDGLVGDARGASLTQAVYAAI